MRGYVLCGGFGTRLRSVTDSQKALVLVHGEPFLACVLRQLAMAGVSEAVLCAHYRAEDIEQQLEALSTDSGLQLKLVIEASPMGTGGALLNALKEHPASERYLVLNADTYLDSDGYRLLLDGQGNAVLGVQVDDRQRFGSLHTTQDGDLLALQEKGLSGAGLINGGLYAFMPDAFSGSALQVCSLERDLLPELLLRQRISVVPYSGGFTDIGTPESLERYRNAYAPVAQL